MRNIKLIIEYDGSAYCGWQIQKNGPSVQGTVQSAISKMTGKKVTLIGASRTDSGVHAYGQTANFKTESKINCDGFLKGLNSLLPKDISIVSVKDVSLEFHAKKDAKGKHYKYLIHNSMIKPALMRDRVWFVKKPLDIKLMKKGAKVLIGMHDFTSFCASGDSNKSKVREIFDIKISKKGSLITIDLFGSGFLKQMVRNIVGTVTSILAKQALQLQNENVAAELALRNILDSKDRKKAGVTAPAHGLYLVKVFY